MQIAIVEDKRVVRCSHMSAQGSGSVELSLFILGRKALMASTAHNKGAVQVFSVILASVLAIVPAFRIRYLE